MALADLVVVMNGGRIEQAAPPREVFNRPASAFVAKFIGGHNVMPSARGLVAVRADRTRLARAGVPESDTATRATVRGVEYQGSYVLLTLSSERVPEFSVVLPERDFDAAPWSQRLELPAARTALTTVGLPARGPHKTGSAQKATTGSAASQMACADAASIA